MTTIHKKICMVGDFAVGKTSLTRRFVSNVFSDDYLSTVGVKIETHTAPISAEDSVKLVIWDIAGSDQLDALKSTYLQGAGGYMLIADGTRRNSLDSALSLQSEIVKQLDHVPCRLLLNKVDLEESWEISKADYEAIDKTCIPYLETSALTGKDVEKAFHELAKELWQKQ